MQNPKKMRTICPKFAFEGVAVSRELEREANAELVKILALGPPGGRGAGVLYRTAHRYSATLVLESPYRNFKASASGTNPSVVVRKVLAKLESELFVWRHGTGAPQAMAVYEWNAA